MNFNVKLFISLLILIVTLESGIRFFCFVYPNCVSCMTAWSWKQKIHEDLVTDPILKKDFCDFIHTTSEGQEKIASSLFNYLIHNKPNLKFKVIWLLGGSTTEGRDCSEKTWGELLNKKFKNENINIQIINFGCSGCTSDDSLKILKENLATRSSPDLIIWDHWINEIIYTTANPKKLDGIELLKKNELYYSALVTRFFSIYSYSVRIFSNLINESNRTNLLKIYASQIQNDPRGFNSRIKNFLWLGFDESLSENRLVILPSVMNKKLKVLNELALNNKIQLLFIQMPYIDDYYVKVLPDINHALFKRALPLAAEINRKFAQDNGHFWLDTRIIYSLGENSERVGL